MERYTYHDGDGTAHMMAVAKNKPCYTCKSIAQCDSCWFGKVIDRLAAYEDTAMLPNEISDLMIANGEKAEEITRLRAELARVERERDAAVADMKNIIRNSPPHTDPCDVCTHPCGKIEIKIDWCDKFEWRRTEEI